MCTYIENLRFKSNQVMHALSQLGIHSDLRTALLGSGIILRSMFGPGLGAMLINGLYVLWAFLPDLYGLYGWEFCEDPAPSLKLLEKELVKFLS